MPKSYPYYKVRVVFQGAIIHLASTTEPAQDHISGQWLADWIEDSSYGDTIGFIDWESILAITWREVNNA